MRLDSHGALARRDRRSALALVAVAAWVVALMAACGGRATLFRPYEYEEDLYLSLDGAATLYVNSSVEALNALRGATFDPAALQSSDVEAYFTAPGVDVTRVTFSRRHARRYVHVRLRVADVRQLGHAPRFSWSTYAFERRDDLYVYRQRVGRPATGSSPVGWQGDELVAFRLHIPSKVVYHNVDRVRRGNILAWEQPLQDRLTGRPIEIEARMESQSILYRTLGLFGVALLLVAVMFAGVLWWLVRLSRRRSAATKPGPSVRTGARA